MRQIEAGLIRQTAGLIQIRQTNLPQAEMEI